MHESREMLREQIRSKRASEGLSEIPDDLIAKKPRHDLSAEEQDRLQERRKRNKQAVEKSRKKKKEEFEKLQNENDQLNQDKCELVAMVDKLKQDLQGLLEENRGLRTNSNHLKHWTGKHAAEFGLNKHLEKKEARNVHGLDPANDSPLLHGDPALPSTDHLDDNVEKLVAKTPPSSPRVSRSPPLAAGLNVSVHHHVPWQVPSSEKCLALDSKGAEAVSLVLSVVIRMSSSWRTRHCWPAHPRPSRPPRSSRPPPRPSASLPG